MKNYNVCLNDLIDNTGLIINKVYINYFEDDDILVSGCEAISISTKNIEVIECNENIYTKECQTQLIVDNICIGQYIELKDKTVIKEDNYGFIYFKEYYYKDNKYYVDGEELSILLLLTDLL